MDGNRQHHPNGHHDECDQPSKPRLNTGAFEQPKEQQLVTPQP